MNNIGLQLYTLKTETEKDFIGTLKKVAEMGYDGVEFAGYFDTPAKELSKVIEDLGLKAAGTHIGYDSLITDLEQAIDYAKTINCEAILCPIIPGDRVNERDHFLQAADNFNRFGEKCEENGLKFLYHIHGQEFIRFENE